MFSGEEIEITFSYWDGSGHRKTVKVKHNYRFPLSRVQKLNRADTLFIFSLMSLCLFPLQMKKGNTIQNFLQRALEVLRKDFSELR